MPLEELGLLCLLEKIGSSEEPMDAYARYGLFQRGLITDSEPPRRTEAGDARMAELQAWRAEGEDEDDAEPTGR